MDSATKKCSRCGEVKPLTEFYVRADRDVPRHDCKVCGIAYTKAYAARRMAEDPDYVSERNRRNQLRVKFQMTPADYDDRLASQGGGCRVCGRVEVHTKNGKVKRLCVDHDRRCCPGQNSCGRCIRGVICNRCNTILGMTDDNIDVLMGLVDYLHEASSMLVVIGPNSLR